MSPNPAVLTWPRRVAAAGGISFLDTKIYLGTGNPHTFSNINLGAESSDRYIVVAVSTRDHSPSALTVAGVSATKIHERVLTNRNSMWLANVPTGSSGDIVVTSSNSTQSRWHFGAWSITGKGSVTCAATAYADLSGTATTISAQTGDIIVAASEIFDRAGPCVFEGVSKDYELYTYPLNTAGGSYTATSTTTLTVKSTWSVTDQNCPLIVAAFRGAS